MFRRTLLKCYQWMIPNAILKSILFETNGTVNYSIITPNILFIDWARPGKMYVYFAVT